MLRPDCLETLAALQQSSIHVQIVSNIDDEQFEPMLERLDLFRVIDAWTSSEQARLLQAGSRHLPPCGHQGGRPGTGALRGRQHPPRRRGAGGARHAHGVAGASRRVPTRPGNARPDAVITAWRRCSISPESGRPMTRDALEAYLDERLGDRIPLRVTPMVGGGSCEVFALDRGPDRWVLRRAPKHASSSTAHDVLREFRILDAIKDTPVPIARPVVACGDSEVFGAPFYVMDRIPGIARPARPCLRHGRRHPSHTGGRSRSSSTPSWRSTPSTGRHAAWAIWPTATTTCRDS